ncbi:sulfatase-like hydrolase/transferase [Snodgrassella communis]|uniref:Sulfatase N-terminal domain-containing protein n=1 Tax=Snodgrassella alvi TaxID=1196083 RepID=A0A2N9XWY5_9NEIS|nr:phosphoethanolamine transferase [Snodgrassella communis]PIT54388.1 hypothetical protein BHC48_00115 [Snodgrassella communis]
MEKKKVLLLYILYLVSTIILLFGLGYIKNWDNKNIIVGLMFFFCYVLSSKFKYTLLILLISFSILSFYFPTGIIYGKPTEAILGSLLQTNKLEAIGYLMVIKYKILVMILFICIQILIYLTAKNSKYKFNYFYFLIFLFLYVTSLFGISINHHRLNEDAFLKNLITSSKIIHRQKIEQRMSLGDSSNIKIESIIDNNDDTQVRVVIIGEAVRKDYMSVYGYPHTTTPFLNSAKGIFIDGLVSAGPNTQLSLTRTLFRADPSENIIHWGINIVSLANKAGYKTYWISNQGANGWGDDVFFNLSKLATQNKFLKTGDFESGNNDDEEMLPIFKNIINSNANNKVIFIHMMGSHEPVCSRVGNYKPSFKIYNEAGCYVATIEKLDLFIKKITEILKDKKYKLMYFSDHGLSVEKTTIFHDNDLYEEYQVPLFYLDSESKEQIHIKKKLSGLNLLDIYSTFINIKTNVTDHKYSFQLASELADNIDPIIYWEKYKHLSTIQKRQPPVIDIETNITKEILELKNNYTFTDQCISYVDYVKIAFPANPQIYKIVGWAASTKEKEPVNGIVGSFIVNKSKVIFIKGDAESRSGVREHFNMPKDTNSNYGIVSFLDKKYINDNKENIYVGYRDKSNHYYICSKPYN